MTNYAATHVLVGAALILAASAAGASPTWSTARVAVGTTGIDLGTAAGRVAFDRRVDAAIAAMCGTPVLGTRDEADALRECRDEARTAAAPEVKRLVARAATAVASSRP